MTSAKYLRRRLTGPPPSRIDSSPPRHIVYGRILVVRIGDVDVRKHFRRGRQMAQLFTLHEQSDKHVRLQKRMQEVDVMVEISTEYDAALVPDTGIGFLDHLIASLSWGLCMSIGCTATVGRWRSTHTIAEDSAQTIGAALKYLYYRKMVAQGVNAFGSAEACLDEALARAMVSVEGRRSAVVSVEGFAQGLPATVRVDLLTGENPHHVWEAAFTALGEALRIAYATNPFRIAKNNPYYADEGVADASLA